MIEKRLEMSLDQNSQLDQEFMGIDTFIKTQ